MTQKQYFYGTWFLSFISGFAVAPFLQTAALLSGGMPINNLLWVVVLEGLCYGLAIFFGMKLAHKVGARFLLLSHNVNWKSDLFKPGILCGISAALAMLLVDFMLPKASMTFWFLLTHIPLSQGLPAAVFGIVNQQVALCLLLISGILIVLKKIFKQTSSNSLMFVSIILSALIFGAAHVPQFVHGMTPEAPLLIFRIMIINLISGMTFGMFFWKKGFETAVLAHFVVDFILYAIVPALCLFAV